MKITRSTTARLALGAALTGFGAMAGLGLAGVSAANDSAAPSAVVAQTDDNDTSTDTTDTSDSDRPARTDEAALTGAIADQVTAAALAAVPGGTVERVETDGDGAVYEAHMTDADGNRVTVTFDADVNVVEIQEGGGRGGHGGRHGHGDGDCDRDGSADESTTDDSTDDPDATAPDTTPDSTTPSTTTG
jgi:uncharacterized membrane protein YkoI